MFDIGDLVVYSTHGVCQIDDIYEQTIIGKTREYYKLHPVENEQHLTINAPVDGKGISIMEIMDEQEAKDVLQVFRKPSKEDNKKLNGSDRDLLRTARSALVTELSISLDISIEIINKKILKMVRPE